MEAKGRNRRIASVIKSLVICLSLILTHISEAQTWENIAENKVVFIGDIHIDQDIFTNIKASHRDLTCMTRFQEKTSFTNAIYLFEAPVSLQYYIRKYFETSDTTFLSIISNLTHEVNFIRYLKEVKKLEAADFFCYDSDTKTFKKTVIDVLYYLFFYEPYKKSFKDQHFRSAGLDNKDYNKNVIQNEKLIDSLNLPKSVDMMNNLIWNSRYRRSLDPGKLKKKFDKCLNDTACMRGLKILLGSNYDYFETLLRSYIKSASLNLKKESDYGKREENTTEVIRQIIKKYGNDKQIVINCGIRHSFLNDSTTLAFKLNQSYPSSSIYIIYENFKYVYPKRFSKYFEVTHKQWLKLEKNELLYFCD